VADSAYRSLGEETRPTVYYCSEQDPLREWPQFVVHFGAVVAGSTAIERALTNPGDPTSVRANAMRELVALALLPQRLASLVLTLIGALGLGLATAGVYGLMTYTVNRRLPEMGIRLALGAAPRDVLRLLLLQGMRMMCAGIVIGALLSAAASRVLSTFLAGGIRGTDSVSFAGVFLLLTGCGLAATLLPALRATSADPVQALRSE
jgi:ABC-type lipoprotein release transport system permease subunit